MLIAGKLLREGFASAGLAKWPRYCWIIHPAGYSVTILLEYLQLRFCLGDTTSEFLGLAAKIHTPQLVELRKQALNFALPLFQPGMQNTIE
ncbi:hypothetical protein OI71_17765 [Aeromonas hydrophila]|nr:hypothetical protein OI71_17765 [Aeromonas hydrophila]